MVKKLKIFVQNPVYILTSLASKGLLQWIPDVWYIKMVFKGLSGEKLNLDTPVTYNEKMQWLKLHDHKPEYSQMVDKYEVRKLIEEKFGKEYLIPLIGVYNRFSDIDFKNLPNQFVMKCTHDSGSVVICKDKDNFDIEAAKKKLQKAMKRNYYFAYKEWPYKNVIPRIIIEQFMVDESGDDLKDYKIMCFNGRAKVIETHENRFTAGKTHTQTFYDRDWNKLDIIQEGLPIVEEDREKPEQMDKMIALSETLAHDMYHARIDWYIINGQIYFGEITFYDGSGFEPFPKRADNEYLGSLLQLDIENNKRI